MQHFNKFSGTSFGPYYDLKINVIVNENENALDLKVSDYIKVKRSN